MDKYGNLDYEEIMAVLAKRLDARLAARWLRLRRRRRLVVPNSTF